MLNVVRQIIITPHVNLHANDFVVVYQNEVSDSYPRTLSLEYFHWTKYTPVDALKDVQDRYFELIEDWDKTKDNFFFFDGTGFKVFYNEDKERWEFKP